MTSTLRGGPDARRASGPIKTAGFPKDWVTGLDELYVASESLKANRHLKARSYLEGTQLGMRDAVATRHGLLEN